MRRREFITLVGGAAAAWPEMVQAQSKEHPVIGYMFTGSPAAAAPLIVEFRKGLIETGFSEGSNVSIEYRWGMGQYDKLPTLVADLVGRGVNVLAPSAPPAVLAAKALAIDTPIVFVVGDDPVRLGLVSSLNRPGGNVTGASYFATALEAKRIELLRTMVPNIGLLGVLMNQTFPATSTQVKEVQEATTTLDQKTHILYADNVDQLDESFKVLKSVGANALLVGADPFFFSQRAKIVRLAAQYSMPAVFQLREFAAEGGLLSYGTVIKDAYRQQGNYVGRILKGEKPSQLPVMLSTKFELVINLATAKMLGLAVPDKLMALADEVIE